MPFPLSFTVDGLPPKKTSWRSLWTQPSEVPRLKSLRAAALEAMAGKPSAAEPLGLRLLIYAEAEDGDLDGFIAGVMEGLQAAHPRTALRLADWTDLPLGALPTEAIIWKDDRWVFHVSAERLPPGDGGRRYSVEILRA